MAIEGRRRSAQATRGGAKARHVFGTSIGMNEISIQILSDHLNLDEMKPMSYLPIKTITNVLRMSLGAYEKAAREKGLCCVRFNEAESCISGGAVYVYNGQCLKSLLFDHHETLRNHGWPTEAAGFIRRIASDWLKDGDPIRPVVRRAFGDTEA